MDRRRPSFYRSYSLRFLETYLGAQVGGERATVGIGFRARGRNRGNEEERTNEREMEGEGDGGGGVER